MKLSARHAEASGAPGATGTARVDRRISTVLGKLHPGDVAVIDYLDLDRGSAEALLERRVSAVVNASAFISGRFPNLGPELLARAGVLLVDAVGAEVFARVPDGARVRVHEGTVFVDDEAAVEGEELALDGVLERMEQARGGLSTQLESLTHNTTEFLRREQDLLLHGQGVPELATAIAGRPVVVVARDFDHETDLRNLRSFIAEQRPILVGVDAGADTLLGVGLTPDLAVIGEAGLAASGSSLRPPVSDRALTKAREVVLHADASDRLPGADRASRLGVPARRIAASGSTEDIALLIADIRGASLIVTVGTHATLDEFLDRHRTGLGSTFLTRLRVGPRLVDARSIPELYAGRVRLWHLAVVLLAGILALLAALATTPVGEQWFRDVGDVLSLAWSQTTGAAS